jgi:hypothetical protein
VLGGALVVTRERRIGAAVVALSLAWLVFVFVARARLTGPTSSYGALIFSGLADDPVSYVRARLTAPGLYIGLWDFVAPLLPILLLAALRRTPVPWVLLVAALPLLAIRFLGLAWQHHYLAPLVPIAIAVVLQVRNQTTLPRWCVAATLLILLALDFSSFRFAASRWNGGVAAAPHFCPRLPQRIAELDGASARILADTSGKALVEGNLFAKLAERGDVYVTGNFQPPPQHYRFVLLERRPHGDPYPHDYAWIDALIANVRESSPTLLVDDDDVFFAEGDFAL